MNIKIVDPACGSGAFLNKASDILLEIHKLIYDFKKIKNTTTIETKGGKGKDKVKRTATHIKLDSYFDEISARREILIHNIYGVDLNEESVDITKLALFLKVCQEDRKLPDLENNIKCGNSLIDDPNYTDKPFKWEKEFPEIFQDGGFDVVIGNPPYVRQEKIKEIKPYLKEHYETYTGLADLYIYFFEKGMKILKNKGIFSFICANKFTRTKNDEPIRKFILAFMFLKYIDYTGKNVFKDATTNPCVIVIKKDNIANNIIINDEFEIPQVIYDSGIWTFHNPKIMDLKDKITKTGVKLKEIPDVTIYRGILTGYDKAFIIDENTKNQFISENPNSTDIIKPLARGKDIKRYRTKFNNLYLIWTYIGVPIDNYPSIKNHLDQYKENLMKRYDQGKQYWELRACGYYEDFMKEKIVWGNLSIKPNFGYSRDELFVTAPANLLTGKNIKYLLSILNSKITSFYFELIGAKVDSGYLEWKKNRIELIPIYPATPEEQKPLIEKVTEMLEHNTKLQDEINSFKDWLLQTFNIEKLSKKLEKYYELSFNDFLNDVKKKKVNVKSRENYQTLKQEFEKSITIINPLLQKINETDNEIDQMVYELYGLTPEEIQIIEESLYI